MNSDTRRIAADNQTTIGSNRRAARSRSTGKRCLQTEGSVPVSGSPDVIERGNQTDTQAHTRAHIRDDSRARTKYNTKYKPRHLITSLLSLLLTSLSTTLPAVDIPQSSARDNRIQYVNYHPGDVVRINARVGIVSRIVLDPGETIHTIHTGFADGWDITGSAHILTLQPISLPQEQGPSLRPDPRHWHTNIALETDRRLYDFDVHLADPHDNASDYKVFYRVEFRYPEMPQTLHDTHWDLIHSFPNGSANQRPKSWVSLHRQSIAG